MFKLISYSLALGWLFSLSVFKSHLKTFLAKIYQTQKHYIIKTVFVGFGILFFAHPAFSNPSTITLGYRAEHTVVLENSQVPAEQICDLNWPSYQFNHSQCLNLIGGKKLSINEARICGHLGFFWDLFGAGPDDILECLEAIDGRNLSENELNTCGSFTRNSRAIECLSIVAGTNLSQETIEICGHFGGKKKLDCLEALAGKDFSQEEADRCLNEMAGTGWKIRCLRATVADPSRALSQKKRGLGEMISDFFRRVWAVF